LLDQIPLTEIETVTLLEDQGRVLAEPLIAHSSVPLGMLSGMDGVALRGEASVPQGEVVLQEGLNFAFVDTGNPIPEPFDRVLMIERVHQAPGGRIRVQAKD
jgi:putative molybdopterin biosynthesis protein